MRVSTQILTIHPFVDGNLRAGYSALQTGLRNLDLPLLEFHDVEAHTQALDVALRVDGRQLYEPLARLMENLIRAVNDL